MDKLKKDIKSFFIFALVSSILFVVGIPMIPIFAGKIWFLMALGIVFVVFGFYGMPLIWLKYASLKKINRVVVAIEEEHLTMNSEIATQLQIPEKEVKSLITTAINKRYITGYIYDGEKLTLNNKEKLKKQINLQKCANCGAKLVDNETEWYCPYCGDRFPKNL